MDDKIKEATEILEEVTNTTDVPSSVGVLIGWFQSLFQHIATSTGPNALAAQAVTTIEAHKDALAAAVTANTATPAAAGE